MIKKRKEALCKSEGHTHTEIEGMRARESTNENDDDSSNNNSNNNSDWSMQKFRESKADLDQFAEVYCDQQSITVDLS